MPFKILRARGGQETAEAAFFDDVASATAVCVGESHPNPHHHWAQWYLLDHLSDPERPSSTALGLGMEMFQRPFQGVLDDFAAGRIDETALLSRTGWQERWGYDFALYRPVVMLAVKRGVALRALNVAGELRRRVAAAGIDGLSAAERAKLPDMDLDDQSHRAWFDGVMAAMGGAHAHGSGHGGDSDSSSGRDRAERVYSVQVLWDETMAEEAMAWLTGGQGRQLVIIAGNGHCHDSAIVNRLRRRGIDKVVSVRPIVDDGSGNVAAELAQPINDYLFVMTP